MYKGWCHYCPADHCLPLPPPPPAPCPADAASTNTAAATISFVCATYYWCRSAFCRLFIFLLLSFNDVAALFPFLCVWSCHISLVCLFFHFYFSPLLLFTLSYFFPFLSLQSSFRILLLLPLYLLPSLLPFSSASFFFLISLLFLLRINMLLIVNINFHLSISPCIDISRTRS